MFVRGINDLADKRHSETPPAELLPFLDALARLVADQIMREERFHVSANQSVPPVAVRDIAAIKAAPQECFRAGVAPASE